MRTWNAGECCDYALDQGVDDVGFVLAAITPVAGAMAFDPDLVRVPVAVLHVHGSDDRHAPIEGGVGSARIEGGVRARCRTPRRRGRMRMATRPSRS